MVSAVTNSAEGILIEEVFPGEGFCVVSDKMSESVVGTGSVICNRENHTGHVESVGVDFEKHSVITRYADAAFAGNGRS